MLNEWLLTTNKRKKPNRGRWEAEGALWDLQELPGPDDPVATTIYGAPHFDRAVGALFRGLGLPARSQHCLAHGAYTEDLYTERLCTEDWEDTELSRDCRNSPGSEGQQGP